MCAYLLHNARFSLAEGGVAAQFVLNVLHLDLDSTACLLSGRGLRLVVGCGFVSLVRRMHGVVVAHTGTIVVLHVLARRSRGGVSHRRLELGKGVGGGSRLGGLGTEPTVSEHSCFCIT